MDELADIFSIRGKIADNLLNGPRIQGSDKVEYLRQYKLFTKLRLALIAAMKKADFKLNEYGRIEILGNLSDKPIPSSSSFDDQIKRMAMTLVERLDCVLERQNNVTPTKKSAASQKKRGRKKGIPMIDDSRALKLMEKSIGSGISVHKAAQIAVQEIGVMGQSSESHIKRLEKKYARR